MSCTVRALSVAEPGGPIVEIEYEAAPLGPLEVEVEVTHCGVCSTDAGLIDDKYGRSKFPLVARHEAVGVVSAVGAEVTGLQIGTRVGVGATAGACFHCEWCLRGQQQLCPDKDDTAFRGLGGGFASHVRASDWRYATPIPDSMTSGDAAPLLCAGATVFSAIVRHNVRPTDHVAVIGLGGLGHLAVQFLAKWGCHVTVISSTAAKRNDALELGAHDFLDSSEGLTQANGSFDFVLSTVSANLPWDTYLATLRPHGTLSMLGVFGGTMNIAPLSLILGERTLSGGLTGPPSMFRSMMEFADRHAIRPLTETYPVAAISRALDSVRNGTPRYRAVIEF